MTAAHPAGFRVKLLRLEDAAVAREVLALQLTSYQVEAELLGVDALPPQLETPADLRRSPETFWGCYEGPTLVGVLSLEEVGDATEIGRLAVSPTHFRRGIATKLLHHAEAITGPGVVMRVSTGAANAPAIALYERHGFRASGHREVDGVHLVEMTRTTA
jgi:ribosomal protein S18 acetylase RimI-like enzyme